MPKEVEKRVKDLQKRVRELVNALPDEMGNIALNATLDHFQDESFGVNKWPARKESEWTEDRRGRRGLLIASGRLRRANRLQILSPTSFAIVNDTPYADVHNQGFKGAVSQNVREHRRKPRKRKEHTVSAHSRTIQQDIPQRQFIGRRQGIVNLFDKRFKELIKDLFK